MSVVALCLRLDAATPECTLTISPASQHSLAVRGDGSLWAWGLNLEQQTGLPPVGCCILQPAAVPGVPSIAVAGAGGYAHSLAIDANGALWAWGRNDHGQVGNGTRIQVDAPVAIAGLPLAVVAVAAGEYHSLALLADGSLWAWGWNLEGQLGNPAVVGDATTPVAVPGISGASAIAAGVAFSLALKPDGTLWAWGRNFEGITGNGSNSNAPVPVATQATGITAIAAGAYHVLALKDDASLLAWGNNSSAQLGLGSVLGPFNAGYNTPQTIPSLAAIVAIGAGNRHSLAIDSNGSAWSWGSNTLGELGDGSTASYRSSPVAVVGLPAPVTQLAGGASHSLASAADGVLWAWGNNWQGQLGDPGAANTSNVPVRVQRPWDPSPPSDQGNVLTAARRGGDVLLDWSQAPASRFRVTGDDHKTRLATTGRFAPLAAREHLDVGAVSLPPASLYYRLQALTCDGAPGP